MDDPRWEAVDNYLANLLLPADDSLSKALESNAEAKLPAIDVTPLQGKFLHILAQSIGAKRILEVGTLGGYSTIWLAMALPADGKIITLEINEAHAGIAQANVDRAGVQDRVDIRLGRAADKMRDLISHGQEPFDLIFIDADKPSNPEYFDLALKLSRVGTVIICDNVVRDGAVTDEANNDPNVIGTRQFMDILSRNRRVMATVIQTVGRKGYDGFAMALVTSQ